MTCSIPPVVEDNELVYSSLSNAVIAAGESSFSAAMAASSARAAATAATLAVSSKNAAFSSETLASDSAAVATTKSYNATIKAGEAKMERDSAHKWASEKEAVWVSDGVNVPGFSAYHWAKQAQHENGLTKGTIAQHITDGVANYITYNAIGNSLLNTALGTRIDQIDIIDARTRADALITLQEIIDRGTAITNERILRLEGEEQLAQTIDTLSATTVANIAAAVLVESSARATDYDASAMVMSLLTAQLNDPVTGLEKTRADILTESEVRVTDQEAMASTIETLIATYNTAISSASAAIQNEQTTRASENSALAESITTLQASVGSQTTSIQVAQSVVDGINAKYTVKIDNNGYVSGYGLLSTAVDGIPVSSFAIRADTFSIGAPAVPASAGQGAVAASKVYPFIVKTTKEIIDGTLFQPGVYMNNAFITKLTSDQIDTRGLTIRDDAGYVIFGSGSGIGDFGSGLDYSHVGGGTAPAPNATRNVFQGDWNTGTEYHLGDIVLDTLGYGWSCMLLNVASQSITTPVYPATSNAYWTLYAVKGVDAISVIIPNDTHTFPATSDGVVSDYSNSGTTITVYDGTQLLAYDAVGIALASWKVTTTATNVTVGALSVNAGILTVGVQSGVDSAIDSSAILYNISGVRTSGVAFSLSAQQSFSKSKAGIDPYIVQLESTNGNEFRVGQSKYTLLIAHVFQGGAEVTDQLSESQFRWRRVSVTDESPPNNDATWNNLYRSGYKQISVDIDAVASKATFFCDIFSLT